MITQAAVLAVLAGTVGVSVPGGLVGLGCAALAVGLLSYALVRCNAKVLGPADLVTLLRAVLVGGVAALVADSFVHSIPVGVLTTLAVVALALDAVDGRVARRTGTASAVGARFDMEVDAVLVLLLSVYIARSLGLWVLAIGSVHVHAGRRPLGPALATRRDAAALLVQGRGGRPGHRADHGGGGRPAAHRRRPGSRRRGGATHRVVRTGGVVAVARSSHRVRRRCRTHGSKGHRGARPPDGGAECCRR